MIYDNPLREALRQTLDGLLNHIPTIFEDTEGPTSLGHLNWMITHALANLKMWPTDKTSRWIGYVQGVLAARGLLDVDEERARTRPFFHEAYERMNLKSPETAEPSYCTLTVNGMEHKTTAPTITYDEVVALAYPGRLIPEGMVFSVVYSISEWHSGILLPGATIVLTAKTARFDVAHTGNA